MLKKSAELIERNYRETILKYQKKAEKQLFREYEIEENDWTSKILF